MGVVRAERKDDYAVVWITKEPVNLMGMAVWQELRDTLQDLEADKSIRGVIFASGLKRDVFTAGNDINELYAPKTSEERYAKFWILSNHFLSQVYKSRLATISAIKGACPAGGCALSICCDERIMTEQGHIGLNEVNLGIPVPKYWARILATIVGQQQAQEMCLNAALLSPQQALACGLIHKVVSKDNLLLDAETRMQQILKLPDHGRASTKQYFREDSCREWEQYAVTEPAQAWKLLSSPALVKSLEKYMAGLAGKKQSKL